MPEIDNHRSKPSKVEDEEEDEFQFVPGEASALERGPLLLRKEATFSPRSPRKSVGSYRSVCHPRHLQLFRLFMPFLKLPPAEAIGARRKCLLFRFW